MATLLSVNVGAALGSLCGAVCIVGGIVVASVISIMIIHYSPKRCQSCGFRDRPVAFKNGRCPRCDSLEEP